MTEQRDDYLWDRSGDPDPEIERLESLLRPLRHHRPPSNTEQHRSIRATEQHRATLATEQHRATLATEQHGSTLATEQHRSTLFRRARVGLALAATLLLAVSGWFGWGVFRGGWAVQTLAGAPSVDGRALDGDGLLRRGGRLVTDGASRARISVGRIGRVDVGPDSRIELVSAGGRDHRMTLERGTIHAQISAPPRFFNVNTPSAVAVDLGCAYMLQVDDSGAGLLHVTHGWVMFDYNGRYAYIPQGAVGATRPGVGPGTPRYADAPAGYAEALTTLDFGPADGAGRTTALDVVLAGARKRDALTLWHLLSRGSAPERARVYDHLARLAPPPRSVTREAVLSGDSAALNAWWDSFGFDGTKWWQRLKKKK